MGVIKINGVEYSGNSVYVNGDKVIVDDKVVEYHKGSIINVTIKGSVSTIRSTGSVSVYGNTGMIECGGSINVQGDVDGDIDCGGSCVVTGSVDGNIDAGGSVSVIKQG